MSKKELEPTDEMISRNDEIDNAVYNCICTLIEREIEWDMYIIAEVTEAIKVELKERGYKVRHPGITEDENGNQVYDDYL